MYNTQMNKELSQLAEQLAEAILGLVGLMNQPQRDMVLLKEAGVSLDRALFPLLVAIDRRGPLGVVDLAGLVGRDYTTVSRQLAKLESLGLVVRQPNKSDRRISEVTVSERGQEITGALDVAREKLLGAILADWSEQDKESLVRLLSRFTKDAASLPNSAKDETSAPSD